MIDIARAMLSGGDIGNYQIGRGMSAVVLSGVGVSLAQFLDLVRDAGTDDEVARLLAERTAVPFEALSGRMRALTVADVPPQLRPEFERLYGTHLSADARVFDVLDADDANFFPQGG